MSTLLPFREPFPAWSHFVWFWVALPAAIRLWCRERGDRARRRALAVYGATLLWCLAGSVLYHGVRAPGSLIAAAAVLDYIGIYLLIAGSYTPIALAVGSRAGRRGLLASIWSLAATGTALSLVPTEIPLGIRTGLYVLMGWGGLLGCLGVLRGLAPPDLGLLILCGLLYTSGAILNARGRPLPGPFNAHDVFHVCVMGASLCHYLVLWRSLATGRRAALGAPPGGSGSGAGSRYPAGSPCP
jgi:hemolysin III